MSAKAIQAIEISKRFGTTQAVRTLNLDVEESEFFSLLGPSGCGKTTLLRMIAGFETPTEGKLLVGGKDVLGVPPHKRPVNMVFQSYALFPHLTVFDNVAFGLKSGLKLKNDEIASRVSEALNLVRLSHLSQRYPSQLSGGQQQRVALARAIVNRPMVLLLDEPLSALDPQIREEMQSELARLQRELNMTFVMVTHDQDEALALSSRIAVFYNGNLEQVGTPKEVYERPETPFVARFIGNTNLLEGTLVSSDRNSAQVKLKDGREVVIEGDTANGAKPGDRVLLSVKPQAVKLVSESQIGLPSTILNRSYLGASTEYVVKSNLGTDLRAAAATDHALAFGIGQSVFVEVDWKNCTLLKDATANSSEGSEKESDIKTTSKTAQTVTERKGD
ncbi:MAG: spermidine/putrescine ABC transporter ATP-binding protein [Candidatus Melainabacteria bacterium]|nr:MAG: spermidine/putrescine ABC transporter ATP-binding protein [Candidatus Melainabacteria bacterium]